MLAKNIVPLHSESFDQLRSLFMSFEPPYDLKDIRDFNDLYRGIYPVLSGEERRRAEDFVDAMIAGVERREWASRIFGVV